MKRTLEVEFPDGFEFPKECDINHYHFHWRKSKCYGCPFYMAPNDRLETGQDCFLRIKITKGECPFYTENRPN